MNWIARYNDNTSLPQYNEDGSENKYADIDRTKLASFALVNETRQVFELHLDEGQRLIFRRRIEKSPGSVFCVYLVGWQQTVSGENIQSIAYVTECGEVSMAGRWREDHRWFYAVQAVPSETVE